MTSVLNTGTIRSTAGYGVLNNSGQMGELTNAGLINGAYYGVGALKSGAASAVLGTLTNSGTISGATKGVTNYGGYIGTNDNQAGAQILATGSALPDTAAVHNSSAVFNGVAYQGTIGAIRNAGRFPAATTASITTIRSARSITWRAA